MNKPKSVNHLDPRLKKLRNNREGQNIGEFFIEKHIGWHTSPSGKNFPLYRACCSCGNKKIFNGKYLSLLERKEKKLNVGKGSKQWRLNCNDHPHHFTSARIGDRLSFLEVIDLPRNTGQISWVNRKRVTDGPGKYLIACICHSQSPNCKHGNKSNPKFITYRNWTQRLEKVEKGKYTSCGCLGSGLSHGLLVSDSLKDKARIALFYNASANSKKKKLPIDIDPEYMKSLEFPDICPVLGIPILYDAEARSENSPSLDKFDPKLGYVKGNVQIISWKANRLKSDGSPQDWMKIAEWCKKKDVVSKLRTQEDKK